jgi:hypothetical protein
MRDTGERPVELFAYDIGRTQLERLAVNLWIHILGTNFSPNEDHKRHNQFREIPANLSVDCQCDLSSLLSQMTDFIAQSNTKKALLLKVYLAEKHIVQDISNSNSSIAGLSPDLHVGSESCRTGDVLRQSERVTYIHDKQHDIRLLESLYIRLWHCLN